MAFSCDSSMSTRCRVGMDEGSANPSLSFQGCFCMFLQTVFVSMRGSRRARYSTKSATPTRQSVNTAKKTNDASLRESKPVC